MSFSAHAVDACPLELKFVRSRVNGSRARPPLWPVAGILRMRTTVGVHVGIPRRVPAAWCRARPGPAPDFSNTRPQSGRGAQRGQRQPRLECVLYLLSCSIARAECDGILGGLVIDVTWLCGPDGRSSSTRRTRTVQVSSKSKEKKKKEQGQTGNQPLEDSRLVSSYGLRDSVLSTPPPLHLSTSPLLQGILHMGSLDFSPVL